MRSEERLRELLREAPVPDAAGAERRGLLLVEAAFAERARGEGERARRSPAPRLAVALAAALLLTALVLSPAGASVRHWVGDVFATETPAPAPALTSIPGGGRLLVQSEAGPWVVQADGSRRLLGRYEEASWSPHGLFVAAAAGHTLSAIEPDGDPHWSISAPGIVSDPRWSPSGFRIAYRSGGSVRFVHATGEEDALLARRAAPVAPVWFPPGLHYLAYVDGGGALRIADVDRDRELGTAPALPGIAGLGWSADGSEILEYSPRALRVRQVTPAKLLDHFELGPSHELPLPAGGTLAAAAFSPDGQTIAVVLQLPGTGGRPAHSEVALLEPGGPARRLLSVPGSLSSVTWSPLGDRLLIPWPGPDEWLFIPTAAGAERAFGPISPEFAPGAGAGAGFPRVEGWCCTQEQSREGG